MDNIFHEREQELFHACGDLAPEQRDSYLNQACNRDLDMRRRIERLLAAHERAKRAAVSPSPLIAMISADMPDSIGSYQLIRVLGEGGMGVVYEAEQQEPVRRRVALKIVKFGMDTKQIVARFMTERQALAAMDHPYVAKVFAAGQTVAGRPYFVMELVEGVPLLEYCETNRLSIRDRVELFVLICQAVQHAHQKGVIHRDLKPSNVLVSSSTGMAIPKIIDFGIAKAVGVDAPDRITELTHIDNVLGTPAYMSPEQAALGRMDIDTRTDVYSLGVLLYELLAGCLPTDPAKYGYAAFLSLLANGELEPAPPSSRASEGLRRLIKGDLDWVVMKSLEVDRGRRYETAVALAEDLRRYLKEEPVSARSPTMSYRFGKFVRRHRVQVVAASVAGVALLAGIAATAVGIIRATRAETTAKQEAATSRQVSDFLVRLLTLANPQEVPGRPITVREVLDRGARTIDTDLKGQPTVQANLFGTLSKVYEALGQYPDAKRFAEKSLALPHADGRDGDLQTAATLLQLGRVNQRLGDMEQTRRLFEQALALRVRALGENHLDTARDLNNLGAIHGQMERYDDAISAHQRALAIQRRLRGSNHTDVGHSLRGLAIVEDRKGNVEAGLKYFRAAQEIFEKNYGDSHVFTATGLQDIAVSLKTLKKFEEARVALERSLAILKRVHGPNHPDVSFSLHSLGTVLVAQGKLKAALAFLEDGFRIRMATMGPDNPRTADIAESLGTVWASLGDLDKSRQLLEQALQGHQRAYGPDHSSTRETHGNLALTLVKANRYNEAMPHLRAALIRGVPPGLQIDLRDSSFDLMRKMESFRELEAQVNRISEEQNRARSGTDSDPSH